MGDRGTRATTGGPPRHSRFSNRVHVLLAALALVASPGCEIALPEESGEGPGHRAQHLSLRPDEELALGQQAYRQILSKSRQRILPADDPQVQMVRRIAGRVV